MRIGIIKEGKVPNDARVALTPAQCAFIQKKHPQIEILVQPSPLRCIADAAYEQAGIQLSEDMASCEVLLGIKEVPLDMLIPDKTYFFFSHTIKKQPHNQKLLQTVLEKNIRLIDYETLTTPEGVRVVAFGRWAGIVGAHNGLMAYAHRSKSFELQQMHHYDTFANAKAYYQSIASQIPAMKIVVTGTGRVSSGAVDVLDALGIRRVSPQVYLNNSFNVPVYTQLASQDYARECSGKPFDIDNFYKFPQNYESIFAPYTKVSDLMINGIFWDKNAPQFFTQAEMQAPDFKIRTIADVTCDIAPNSSIPSTLYASTINEPVFGYDPFQNKAVSPYSGEQIIDVMSIDNLPSELPKDASAAFGDLFIKFVLDELVQSRPSGMLQRATITERGRLTEKFAYLSDYAAGE